jgi:hypothetical protein
MFRTVRVSKVCDRVYIYGEEHFGMSIRLRPKKTLWYLGAGCGEDAGFEGHIGAH